MKSLALIKHPGALIEVQKISEIAKRFAGSDQSNNTVRTYNIAIRDFACYCQGKNFSYLPATPVTVIEYISELAERCGAKVSTIRVRLSAISQIHKLYKYDDPTEDPIVSKVLGGIKREKGSRSNQREPLLREDLLKIVSESPRNLIAVRDRAMLLVGWAGAFRRSELVNIRVDDVKIYETKINIIIPFSKGDQYGKGEIKHIPALKNKFICPVAAMKRWLDESKIVEGFIFRKIDRWGKIGMNAEKHIRHRIVTAIVKDAVAEIGLDASKYSSHSLRIGFITQASLDGYDAVAIKKVSLHKSLGMIARYDRSGEEKAHEVIKTAFGE